VPVTCRRDLARSLSGLLAFLTTLTNLILRWSGRKAVPNIDLTSLTNLTIAK